MVNYQIAYLHIRHPINLYQISITYCEENTVILFILIIYALKEENKLVNDFAL